LARTEFALTQVFGCSRSDFFLALRRQGKQFLDSDLELTRQSKGDFGIRKVRSCFNRVNGLPRDTDSLRKFCGADAPSLADAGEIGLNTAHFISSLVQLAVGQQGI
jgi:hypothetical protein